MKTVDIACPRERTWMSPCICRDGATALADDGRCVCCGITPQQALEELGANYIPAREVTLEELDAEDIANRLPALVRNYVTGLAA